MFPRVSVEAMVAVTPAPDQGRDIYDNAKRAHALSLAGEACVYVAIICFQNTAHPIVNALQYSISILDLAGSRLDDIDSESYEHHDGLDRRSIHAEGLKP
ncbi:hypothetical protein GGR54DRAFT_638939 [Hypoxylon sp. NC1633]|nr:hypothetical protein GGR54DRAFT_638939 [Hypoxylon sp. NC1633]